MPVVITLLVAVWEQVAHNPRLNVNDQAAAAKTDLMSPLSLFFLWGWLCMFVCLCCANLMDLFGLQMKVWKLVNIRSSTRRIQFRQVRVKVNLYLLHQLTSSLESWFCFGCVVSWWILGSISVAKLLARSFRSTLFENGGRSSYIDTFATFEQMISP